MNRGQQKGTAIRNGLMALAVVLCTITSAAAQVSVNVGLPGVSIGINQPAYPELVVVPGYPVYYAPQVNANYFFYDGMFWVYDQDNWYASTWYNGPWEVVDPDTVPLFILRIPVRFYRQPPSYFRGWNADAAPRWGDHWGEAWQQHRSGWDTWNHSSVPAPAPLPVYQRQYSGNRYPAAAQQQVLQSQNYRYRPQDTVAQHYYQAHGAQSAPAASPARAAPGVARGQAPQRGQPPQKENEEAQKAAAKAPAPEKAQASRPAVANAPAAEPKARTQKATPAKAPAEEAKAQTEKAAPAKAAPQEAKAKTPRPAPPKPPVQEQKAQTQRPAPAKPPVQEQKAQPQRPAPAKPPAQEQKAQPERPAPAKAAPEPKQEPKEGQEKGHE